MHRFLPISSTNVPWGFAAQSPGDKNRFVVIEPGQMDAIGSQMHVGNGNSDPYSPTPFSRALTFETLLLDGGNPVLRQRAIRTFRGLWSLLALRDKLGIKIQINTCSLNRGVGATDIRQSLDEAIIRIPGCVAQGDDPAKLLKAQQNIQFWRELPFLTVIPPDGKQQVLCGLSPKTIVYPSAHQPDMDCLYWYRKCGGQYEWFDPTEDNPALSDQGGVYLVQPSRSALVKGMLLTWLNTVIANITNASNNLSVLGCPCANSVRLRQAFEAWRNQLVASGVRPLGNVQAVPLTNGAQVDVLAQVVVPSADAPTREDEIFTDYLAEVDPFSESWKGSRLDAEDRSFLLPLKREIIEHYSSEFLVHGTSIVVQNQGINRNYVVTLTLNGISFSRLFVQRRQDGQDAGVLKILNRGKLDVRVFPDFYVTTPTGGQVLDNQDAEFYIRVRSVPSPNEASMKVSVLARDYNGLLAPASAVSVLPSSLTEQNICAKVYQVNASFVPVGVYVDECGAAFFTPEKKVMNSREAGLWDVAIDFGTANTCIVYRPRANNQNEILRIPTLCSAMARQCQYDGGANAVGGRAEFGAAILDFFFLLSGNEKYAYETNYFPSQFVTKLVKNEQIVNNPGHPFELNNGLIYFQNISQADVLVGNEVEDFPVKNPRPNRPFRLKDDIKWTNRQWRKSFMAHLRKMVVLTAAKERALVESLVISFPLAFDHQAVELCKEEVKAVWNNLKPEHIKSITESVAMHSFFQALDNLNDNVVLDVGGGTTDILATNDLTARYQSSFELAARQINEFVVRSKAFRDALLKVALPLCDGKYRDDFQTYLSQKWDPLRPISATFIQLAWFGLLKVMSEDSQWAQMVCNLRLDATSNNSATGAKGKDEQGKGNASDVMSPALRQAEMKEQQQAVTKFFWALTILFTSVAFYAGRMFNASLKVVGASKPRARICLHLTGNGAKLFDFINSGSDGKAGQLLTEMFLKGFQPEQAVDVLFCGVPSINEKTAPKEIVAWGAIASAKNNIAIRPGYFDEDVKYFESAISTHKDNTGKLNMGVLPEFNRLKMMDDYLAVLKELIVNGRFDGKTVIVPMAPQAVSMKVDEMYEQGMVRVRIQQSLRKSIVKYASDMGQGDADAAHATESLFISHVCALFEGALY